MKGTFEDTPVRYRPFGESFFGKMKSCRPALALLQLKTKAGFHFARGSALQPAPPSVDTPEHLAFA